MTNADLANPHREPDSFFMARLMRRAADAGLVAAAREYAEREAYFRSLGLTPLPGTGSSPEVLTPGNGSAD